MARKREDPAPFGGPKGKSARKSKQKGAQRHAEGMHGPKTRARVLEQLESGKPESAPKPDRKHDATGKHRLFERREQHDNADLNSEKNRLDRDIREHGHNRENFQVQGGAASARATPRNPINPSEPDAPTPGAKPAPPPTRVK
ncbi:MAG: hypothetical protein ACSLFK_06250 [Gemmatimonadaceae bacterium]